MQPPSVVAISAISDGVKRHPNLVDVTVTKGYSSFLFRGVVQGVLQKGNVRKVESWSPSRQSKSLGCECMCMPVYHAVVSH